MEKLAWDSASLLTPSGTDANVDRLCLLTLHPACGLLVVDDVLRPAGVRAFVHRAGLLPALLPRSLEAEVLDDAGEFLERPAARSLRGGTCWDLAKGAAFLGPCGEVVDVEDKRAARGPRPSPFDDFDFEDAFVQDDLLVLLRLYLELVGDFFFSD